MTEGVVWTAIVLLSLALTGQGFFTLYLMLYAWVRPERLAATRSPRTFLPPRLRFAAILPARHEEAVIALTVQRIWAADYPKDLLELVVVCDSRDAATIAEARRAVADLGHPNVRMVTFDDGPISKPHGLNVGLRHTSHEVVTVFDAEDDVHPHLFHVVNTIMQRDDVPVVQAAVQVMDLRSRWYTVHHVLEYFFWFRSRLQFHARVGVVPLGGNTVFARRRLLDAVGGWDERCLTEDADLGIRLGCLRTPMVVTFEAEHATREEAPPTLASFVRQRTRWNQGFLQILRKGDWRRLPTGRQRTLAVYTLALPFAQAVVALLWLPAVVMMLAIEVPVAVAMLSLLPLYAQAFQFVVSLVGLFEFGRAFRVRIGPRDVAMLALGFVPYQVVLSIGALRGVYRELRGLKSWEKTPHTGVHRSPVPEWRAPVISPAQWGRRPDLATDGRGDRAVESVREADPSVVGDD